MSSSMVINAAVKAKMDADFNRCKAGKAVAAAHATSSSSCSSSPGTPEPTAKSPPTSSEKPKMFHQRRPSLLSTAISKQECTTIDIGDDPDGPVKLISYLSSSQGFAWNPEIFLPSYVDYDYEPLESRHEPVHEIKLTDEEIKKIIPQ